MRFPGMRRRKPKPVVTTERKQSAAVCTAYMPRHPGVRCGKRQGHDGRHYQTKGQWTW